LVIIDVNYVIGFLHFVVVVSIADVVKVHAAPIFGLDPEGGGYVYLEDTNSIAHNPRTERHYSRHHLDSPAGSAGTCFAGRRIYRTTWCATRWNGHTDVLSAEPISSGRQASRTT
jgi:hypothetical protein